ncbi:MAG: valine--tRNA ligase [Bergeyella sp.]|nr:valine--tRNA ligase [Bergeyella sp.]
MSEQYNPKISEEKWYKYWQENKYFQSQPDEKPPYTLVIPPPNVTGVLHMGHMLNNTLQDVLVRRARMKGYNACWVPGTDHASIATEAKVVARLKAEGIEKKELTRLEFLHRAWAWTEEFGGAILEQLKKLGCSCDWSRTRFTLEEKLSEQVVKSFVDLYRKGYIYRGYRMINWDPEAETNISDEEVIFREQQGKLYYLKYKIKDSEDFITVATTRPETIFGDTALCVHPEDVRHFRWVGRRVLVPIIGREIPIIADGYVDKDFGTGVLKITPAHDINDYEIGKNHQLPFIEAIDEKGNINEQGKHYRGKDRFLVRKLLAKELEEQNLLLKVEDYMHSVGTSERTGAVIEPRISKQWFLRMEKLAKPALEAVEKNEIRFFPEKYKNIYRHWMENIRDWNISRQLWWGQQIPAYYYGGGDEDFVIAETREAALELARKKSCNSNLADQDLRQDPDVLDTWFSSWLWPISVFDGLIDPKNRDISYYYPTSDLVTGPDILFFWVARMIMAGIAFRGEVPFKNVYFTGIVRDKQRRKMSKSLGNSPDALALIEKYGADSVRVGILLSSAAGNDLLFDEDLLLQGRNFATKIWNAHRLILGWSTEEKEAKTSEREMMNWFENTFNKVTLEIDKRFEQYRVSDALHLLYRLIWDDFCSWYLEGIKPQYGEKLSRETKERSVTFFEDLLRLLHPFMPFLSEELWQKIGERTPEEALIISRQKEAGAFDLSVIERFNKTKQIITGIRNYRQSKGISPKEKIKLFVGIPFLENEEVLKKLGNISHIYFGEKYLGASFSFLVEACEFSIPLSESMDLAEEKNKIQQELEYLRGFLASVEKKLSNERFVRGAPEKVIEIERKKQKDTQEKIFLLEERLKNL